MPRPKGQGKTPGSGRKKGTRNKVPAVVRDLVLEALDAYKKGKSKGAQGFLGDLARDEPKAFATLIAKMIPTAIEGTDGSNLPIVAVRDYRGKEGKD